MVSTHWCRGSWWVFLHECASHALQFLGLSHSCCKVCSSGISKLGRIAVHLVNSKLLNEAAADHWTDTSDNFQVKIYICWYCWWKRSCTTWHVKNLVTNGINSLSTGAGFLPSTVVDYLWSFQWPKCGTVAFWGRNYFASGPRKTWSGGAW